MDNMRTLLWHLQLCKMTTYHEKAGREVCVRFTTVHSRNRDGATEPDANKTLKNRRLQTEGVQWIHSRRRTGSTHVTRKAQQNPIARRPISEQLETNVTEAVSRAEVPQNILQISRNKHLESSRQAALFGYIRVLILLPSGYVQFVTKGRLKWWYSF